MATKPGICLDLNPGPSSTDTSFTSVADELSELLKESSIERHLSGGQELFVALQSPHGPSTQIKSGSRVGEKSQSPRAYSVKEKLERGSRDELRFRTNVEQSSISYELTPLPDSCDRSDIGSDSQRLTTCSDSTGIHTTNITGSKGQADNMETPSLDVPVDHSGGIGTRTHRKKTHVQESQAQGSVGELSPHKNDSPFSADFDQLALQVRDKLSSIFDYVAEKVSPSHLISK